jgi:hypothetical protein
VRYARASLIVALAGRRVLMPATLLAFAVVGVFAYHPNPVQGSWAVTALLSTLFCAWLVAAVEREVGPGAAAILTVLAGGPARGLRGRLTLVAVLTVVVALVFMIWPAASSAFDRTPGAQDVGAAALAHVACGVLGGVLALLLAAPARPATAFALILGAWLASIGLVDLLGPFAGPAGVADALADAPDDRVSAAVVLACAVVFAQAGLLAYGARRLARWRG